MEEKDNIQTESTIEDYKKWYYQAFDENLKLKKEIEQLRELVKAQATFIASTICQPV